MKPHKIANSIAHHHFSPDLCHQMAHQRRIFAIQNNEQFTMNNVQLVNSLQFIVIAKLSPKAKKFTRFTRSREAKLSRRHKEKND